MKKYLFGLFGVVLALTACNQNAPEQKSKVNDYDYLVESLMRFDEEGNITGYMIGDNLNEADPLEISVPVNTYEEAVDIFRSLLPEDAVLKQDGKKYIWSMTDSVGNEDGEIVLEEGTTPDSIAVMRFGKGPKIDPAPARRLPAANQGMPKCVFIPESAWPENAGAAEEILNEEYYLGAIINKTEDEGFGEGTFIVIAPWTPKACGLMIQLDPDSYSFSDMPMKKCSSANLLHRVYRELHKGNNYHDIFEVIGQQPEVNWPTTLNGWYLSKTQQGAAYYCVNLSDNSEKTYRPSTDRKLEAPARVTAASNQMRMAYCYCFKPDGNEIKFW